MKGKLSSYDSEQIHKIIIARSAALHRMVYRAQRRGNLVLLTRRKKARRDLKQKSLLPKNPVDINTAMSYPKINKRGFSGTRRTCSNKLKRKKSVQPKR